MFTDLFALRWNSAALKKVNLARALHEGICALPLAAGRVIPARQQPRSCS